jgi:HAD superfamily hydrolase (TIGR01490 family)
MQKPVAFFDIDGTVFRSSLLIELVEQLINEDIFPPEAELTFATEFEEWRSREGTYQSYIEAVITTFLRHIKGVHYGTFADIAKHVVNEQSKYVYRYTRDLIGKLKREGYYLVAISQSPKTVLDTFCKEYGFDKIYGRIYEIGPQDRFTGTIVDEHLIQNKANIVRRVFERNPELTADRSVAFGDTDGDISLLESVAEPICFNPNKALYDHAQLLDWPVVVERKDMIYHL